MPARRRRIRATVGAVGTALTAALLSGLLAGCAAAAPSSSGAGLTELNRERDRVALAAHERLTDRLAVFLRDKWGPIALPDIRSHAWVEAEDWALAVSACLDDRGFPGARSARDGDHIDYSGVAIVSTRDQYELDVAAFGCQAEHPVRERFAADLIAVEAPWALDYWGGTLAPCLRANGYRATPLPAVDEFAATWRSETAPDPYRFVGSDPGERAAAEARCPAPETLLDAAP